MKRKLDNENKNEAKRKRVSAVLVLDLDRTLIYADWPRTIQDLSALPARDFELWDEFPGWRRPGLDRFLAFAQERFEHIGIFTAATRAYAELIVEQLGIEPKFLFCREQCCYLEQDEAMILVKPLQQLWYSTDLDYLCATPENTVIIDDKPRTAALNPDNLIEIPEFIPSAEVMRDCELHKIQVRLEAWLAER